MNTTSIPCAAREYIANGWMPVPVKAGGKGPIGKNWQTRVVSVSNVDAIFDTDHNIGLLLGAPSGGLVDVDIDSNAAKCLSHLLPATGMVHGRDGNPGSHYWYHVDDEIPATTQFKNPVTGEMIIECRSTGGQTVVPPSSYSTGAGLSVLTWEKYAKPSKINGTELLTIVARIAAITLLASVWNREGSRHVKALAVAGMLLRGGVDVETTQSIIEAVCDLSGDDETEDRLACVESTAAKIAAGDMATGAPTLAELIDSKIVSALSKWLSLQNGTHKWGMIASPTEWDPIIPFDQVKTPENPASLLPGIYGTFAEQLAHAAEVSVSLTTLAVMGVLSAALAKRFVVSPWEGWSEPIVLYILAALPPANLKSLVTREATRPLDTWECAARQSMGPDIAKARSQRKNQESQIQSLRAKAAKNSNKIQQQQQFEEVTLLESSLVEIPVPQQIYVNDVTPETLATVVVEQNGRVAIISDEGGIFEVIAGLYNKGNANYDILLKGIDGGRVRIRRKDRELDVHPLLTLLLIVQPQIVRNMADKKVYQGRGFLERFLYVVPPSLLGRRSLNTPPLSDGVRTQYQQAINRLLNIQPLVVHGSGDVARVLSLDEKARDIWQRFRRDIETELRPDGRLSDCLGWGGKIAGFTLRIAGLLHVAEHGESAKVIKVATMERAVRMAGLLVEHALAAFDMMHNDEASDDARVVFEWLCQQGKSRFRRTECLTKFHGRFTGKKRFDAALNILIDRNMISPLRHETTTEGKRQTGYYEVNPALANEHS
jgi:hypothetical protein